MTESVVVGTVEAEIERLRRISEWAGHAFACEDEFDERGVDLAEIEAALDLGYLDIRLDSDEIDRLQSPGS